MRKILPLRTRIARIRARARKGGFVLVSVLMLSAVLLSCATAFAWFVRTQVRGVLQERVALTNRSMAQVLTNALIDGLVEIGRQTNADSMSQRWYMPFLFPADNLGLWAVQIRPLDDKIPIRNLFLPDGNTIRREMASAWDDMWDAIGHRELAMPMLDFLDKNTRPRVGGQERDNFINRQVLDMSELLIMDEITPAILYGTGAKPGLADLCTLWSDGKINLNVAPPEVLELLPGLRGQSAMIVSYRQENILHNMNDLRSVPGLGARGATQLTNLAGFNSRYFSINISFLDDSPGGMAYNIVIDREEQKVVRWEES